VPVRAEFFNVPPPDGNHAPTLLIFGGSQGAKAINQAMVAAAPAVLRQIPRLQIIHQTGEREYNDVAAAYERAGVKAEVSAFIDDMPAAFARADLLLCRSGASTVAEATAAGKPAIFVPFPQAADDHQRRNAEAIAQPGAAVLVPQAELTPERLTEVITQLFANPARLKQMAERARALSHHDAAGRVARMVAELACA
jgi:UDP-N-acetylglucosamine--N-acetylmuramyl-(pentapeptide) pyrophosphoryl-undecaprenol N-acetylglucosamine transferase